jgi:asparagine synthase (glutamine-hydrolysing)
MEEPAGDPRARVDALEALLRAAVGRRMLADVPLGAFLSGGIDSSTVVALMQAQSARPVRTFAIGFREDDFDEARHARAVASHLGTDHTECVVTGREALAVVPELPEVWDEPFGDSSQLPTLLVSRLARRRVTVALSGDGGDELFHGYTRYVRASRIWARTRRLPAFLRGALASALGGPRLQGVLAGLEPHLPDSLRRAHPADRMPKLAALLDFDDPAAFYAYFVAHQKDAEAWVRGAHVPTAPPAPVPHSSLERLMAGWDLQHYLPDDILTKVDRASMAASLEARVPLLDPAVVTFALALPQEFKVRDGRSKWILREVLHRYVPPALVERPKQGFGVPIEHWLRGPLRDWGEALLARRRLEEEGLFDAGRVRALWEEHQAGTRRWHYLLWDLLMFQAWRETWLSGAPVGAGRRP